MYRWIVEGLRNVKRSLLCDEAQLTQYDTVAALPINFIARVFQHRVSVKLWHDVTDGQLRVTFWGTFNGRLLPEFSTGQATTHLHFGLPPRCWDLHSSGILRGVCGNCLPTFRDNVSVPYSRVGLPGTGFRLGIPLATSHVSLFPPSRCFSFLLS
jgi:hypothetical protein